MVVIKRYAESVSADIGFGGEINGEVLVEAQHRLDEAKMKRNENETQDVQSSTDPGRR